MFKLENIAIIYIQNIMINKLYIYFLIFDILNINSKLH